ncbi:unnamed protein product [Pleuronectes platessa]|uniref:Uncharacterized protein n=1 Tax=Pleuronectes platessa TaxID=8262 RepID=A0A9N7ZCH8_PLEPL|nr:unnamed protein product [Pleuronectes platessa]
MNPADSERLRSEVAAQASLLYQQERQLTTMAEAFHEASACHDQHLEALDDQFQRLVQVCKPPTVSRLVSPPTRVTAGPEPRLNAADRFSGAPAFSDGLRKVFDHATSGREAARGLLNLTQGSRRLLCTVTLRTIPLRLGMSDLCHHLPPVPLILMRLQILQEFHQITWL